MPTRGLCYHLRRSARLQDSWESFVTIEKEELCASMIKMPRKRKIKKEPEESFTPDEKKKSKLNRKKISPLQRARDLAATTALARIEQRNNQKTEANQQGEIRDDITVPHWSPAPVQKCVNNFDITEDEDEDVIFPYKMIQKIEASKAKKGDTTTKNVIFVVAHELTGRWVRSEFTIIGAYHSFQQANEEVMEYFSKLDISIEDDVWKEASSDDGNDRFPDDSNVAHGFGWVFSIVL